MQTTGYIINADTGKKVLLLVRQSKFSRHLKIRQSGSDGVHFPDEELYLNGNKSKLTELITANKIEI